MKLNSGRQFAVEVHPPDWRFPADKSWIAGWILPAEGQTITDIRAKIHHRVILGLSGLPHPAFPEAANQPNTASSAGFSFLLCPQPDATLLRLETCDQSGRWTEFFRTRISSAPAVVLSAPPQNLNHSLSRLTTFLLLQQKRHPQRHRNDLADELIAAFVAEPLDAHPNLPFLGTLEEPHATGRLRYGRIPITGWLAHPSALITRIEAMIDPLPGQNLPHGLARHDVAATFSSLNRQNNTAFVGELALPPDLVAPVLLKIFAELDDGTRHLVFARRFTPQQHGATGLMPPSVSGFAFTKAIWALHRAARRHALPRHGLIRTARALWKDYRALPAYRPDRKFSPTSKTLLTPQNPLHSFPDCTLIAPGDDMRIPGHADYFQIGQDALTLVQHAATLAGCTCIGSVLDLPCGYGRVARWFRTAYPTAQITVSDTQTAGVDFCVQHLGATGVHATLDDLHWEKLPGPYDVIWCGSLLTHFDRKQWITHLRRFTERLTPHGVLIFTSHGLDALALLHSGEKDYGLPPPAVADLHNAAVAEGFGYVDYPETPGYGISIAQPAWILDLLTRETDLQLLELREAAWDEHQDIVVCTRRATKGPGWFRKFFATSF